MRLILQELTNPGVYAISDLDDADGPFGGQVGALSIDANRKEEILAGLTGAAAAEPDRMIIRAAEAIEQRQTAAEPIGRHHASAGTYGHAEGVRCAMRSPWVPEEQRICTCGFDLIDQLIKAVRDRQRQLPELDETADQAQRRRANRVNPEFMKKLEGGRGISQAANVVRHLVAAWVKDGGPEGKECGYLEALEVIVLDLVKRHDELSRRCSDLLLNSEEYQACGKCGRKTWTRSEFGGPCAMTQPSGQGCTGVFR